jgi:DNA polymerase-1
LLYGKSSKGFAEDFNISEEEGQKIIDDYFKGMPKIKSAIDEARIQVNKKGFVQNLFGRKRHFEKITRDNWTGYPNKSYRQAFNFIIQGSSADMMRKAMINVYNLKFKYPDWNLRLLFTVHDEIGVSVNAVYAEQAAREVENAMISSVSFCVPVVSDTQIGNTYGEAK